MPLLKVTGESQYRCYFGLKLPWQDVHLNYCWLGWLGIGLNDNDLFYHFIVNYEIRVELIYASYRCILMVHTLPPTYDRILNGLVCGSVGREWVLIFFCPFNSPSFLGLTIPVSSACWMRLSCYFSPLHFASWIFFCLTEIWSLSRVCLVEKNKKGRNQDGWK